jgi:hypothetical protein
MPRILIGLFIVLHGLVHLWYFTLSQGVVEFKPEMGWSGRSWIFTGLLGESATRSLASVLYVFAALAFVVSGIGIFIRAEWWRPLLLGSAIFSSAIIFLLWDGRLKRIMEKGLLGLLISAVIVAAILLKGVA